MIKKSHFPLFTTKSARKKTEWKHSREQKRIEKRDNKADLPNRLTTNPLKVPIVLIYTYVCELLKLSFLFSIELCVCFFFNCISILSLKCSLKSSLKASRISITQFERKPAPKSTISATKSDNHLSNYLIAMT